MRSLEEAAIWRHERHFFLLEICIQFAVRRSGILVAESSTSYRIWLQGMIAAFSLELSPRWSVVLILSGRVRATPSSPGDLGAWAQNLAPVEEPRRSIEDMTAKINSSELAATGPGGSDSKRTRSSLLATPTGSEAKLAGLDTQWRKN